MSLDTRIPPPIVALATCAAMYKAAAALPQYHCSVLLPPKLFADLAPYTVHIAGTLAAMGVGTILAAVRAFKQLKTTVTPLSPSKSTALVTTGLYSVTRNPMYVGLVGILSAWTVYLHNPVVGAAGIALFMSYITQFQIKPEEAALSKIFPTEYPAYKARVPRWLLF